MMSRRRNFIRQKYYRQRRPFGTESVTIIPDEMPAKSPLQPSSERASAIPLLSLVHHLHACMDSAPQ